MKTVNTNLDMTRVLMVMTPLLYLMGRWFIILAELPPERQRLCRVVAPDQTCTAEILWLHRGMPLYYKNDITGRNAGCFMKGVKDDER